MSRPPVVSARRLVKALHKIGYGVDHQSGSHMILRNKASRRIPSVPNHGETARWTLGSILQQSGLETGEFLDILQALPPLSEPFRLEIRT